jgi:para-aminobenzoate synthetase / 4-amino-4-deoxychorismate lyase
VPIEATVIDLDSDASPGQVLRALAGESDLVCLWGDGWGSTVITSRPLERSATVDRLGEPGPPWFGWLGYDRPHRLTRHDHLLRRTQKGWRIELWPTPGRTAELEAAELRYRAALRTDAAKRQWQAEEFDGPERDDHLRAVETAIGLIRDGELYQVNVCTRLSTAFSGDAVSMFVQAVEAVRPEFGAYLADGGDAVVSLSPELFLRRAAREVISSPIKGTRPRTEVGLEQLRGSAKDVAENVMIVDLVRNDLGRVAAPGTVTTRELLEIQPHPGVWHLVSSVGATLRDEVTDQDLINAMFPPGSVTGAPKLRAMRAIGELESSARGVYTGAVGYSATDTAVFSVAIRTFEISGGRIELGVGGGVTVDSVPALEWQETRDKAAPLIEAVGATLKPAAQLRPTERQLAGGVLETMLSVDGAVRRLADHLARIDLSVRELYGAPLSADAYDAVRRLAAQTSGRRVIRLVVRPGETFEVSDAPLPPPRQAARLRTARRPGCWRHKWADRSWVRDPDELFVDADETLLETSWGSVFLLQADGGLVTPPLREGLLPGVTRRALLDLARDQGRPVELRAFGLDEVWTAAALFTSSSISGLVPIKALDGQRLARADATVRSLSGHLGFALDTNETVS